MGSVSRTLTLYQRIQGFLPTYASIISGYVGGDYTIPPGDEDFFYGWTKDQIIQERVSKSIYSVFFRFIEEFREPYRVEVPLRFLDREWERIMRAPENISNIVAQYVGGEGIDIIKDRVLEVILDIFPDNLYTNHQPFLTIYLDIDGVLSLGNNERERDLCWPYIKQFFRYARYLFSRMKNAESDQDIIREFKVNMNKFQTFFFDPTALQNLFGLLNNVDRVAIVISSAWRKNMNPLDLRKILWFCRPFVIDKTREVDDYLRGREIQLYDIYHRKPRTSFCSLILDDNEFDFDEDEYFQSRFIHVDGNKLLSLKNIEEALEKLDIQLRSKIVI